jgi:hypothetical protein
MPGSIKAVGDGKFALHVTIGQETYDKLMRVTDLMRHRVPTGDLATILDAAVTALVRDVEKTKFAETSKPRDGDCASVSCTRHIPASVKRAVRKRDGNRCAFVGPHRRCAATARLEFHHRIPFAQGGLATVDNLELRCRAHNKYDAELVFGRRAVDPKAAAGQPVETRSGPSGAGEGNPPSARSP